MKEHLKSHRDGFDFGFTPITVVPDSGNPSGIALGVLRLRAAQAARLPVGRETAWLLMDGEAAGKVDGLPFHFSRNSLFDESCSCLHAAAGSTVEIEARRDCEWTVYECENRARFDARVFTPEQVAADLLRAMRGRRHTFLSGIGNRLLLVIQRIWPGYAAVIMKSIGLSAHRRVQAKLLT